MVTELPDITLSLVIGIAFGLIIFYICAYLKQNKHGPNSRDIVKNIYKHNGMCYKFEPVITICPSSISMAN